MAGMAHERLISNADTHKTFTRTEICVNACGCQRTSGAYHGSFRHKPGIDNHLCCGRNLRPSDSGNQGRHVLNRYCQGGSPSRGNNPHHVEARCAGHSRVFGLDSEGRRRVPISNDRVCRFTKHVRRPIAQAILYRHEIRPGQRHLRHQASQSALGRPSLSATADGDSLQRREAGSVQMVPVGGDPCSLICGITRSAASPGSNFASASSCMTVAKH